MQPRECSRFVKWPLITAFTGPRRRSRFSIGIGQTPMISTRIPRGARQKISRALISSMVAYFGFSGPRKTRCSAHRWKAATKTMPMAATITMGRNASKEPRKTICSAMNPDSPGRPREAKKANEMKAV